MSKGTISVIIMFAVILITSILGIIAGRRVKMRLEEWTVGGRRLGGGLIWFLMGGEIYTTFTFLGASGYAYANGAPAFYILVYGALGFALNYYYVQPLIWRMAKRHGFVTQPDFFQHRFQNRWVTTLVAIIGIVFLIPYIQLQLAGLGAIVKIMSYGTVPPAVSMIVSFLLVVIFINVSGLRGTAWTSVIKDVFMIVTVLFLGFGLPVIYFGGIGPLFHKMILEHPHYLTLPGNTKSEGVVWFMSTTLLTGMGFSMFPHAWPSLYAARSDKVIRRNAIFLPFYQIALVLMFIIGFAAILLLPHLSNGGNFSLLDLTVKTYPPTLVALVGAAGALTAIVPASIIVLAAATIFSQNIYRSLFKRTASDRDVVTLSRIVVIVLVGLGLFFTLAAPSGLVPLLLLSYDGMTQFFPAVVLSFAWKRVTSWGVFAGLFSGVALVSVLVLTHHDPVYGINAGLIGVVLNTAVTVTVSLLTAPPHRDVVTEYTTVLLSETGNDGAHGNEMGTVH